MKKVIFKALSRTIYRYSDDLIPIGIILLLIIGLVGGGVLGYNMEKPIPLTENEISAYNDIAKSLFSAGVKDIDSNIEEDYVISISKDKNIIITPSDNRNTKLIYSFENLNNSVSSKEITPKLEPIKTDLQISNTFNGATCGLIASIIIIILLWLIFKFCIVMQEVIDDFLYNFKDFKEEEEKKEIM